MDWTVPSGYRLLVSTDVNKVFGTDLENKIYYDTSQGIDSVEFREILKITNDTIDIIYYSGKKVIDDEDNEHSIMIDDVYLFRNHPSESVPFTETDKTFENGYYLKSFVNNVFIYVKDITKIPVITYVTNGATAIDPVEAGELPELPIPTKSGYNFKGWYYEIDFQTEALEGDLIDDDVTLYAKWTVIPTITYNSNGGSSQEATSGNVLPTLPTPTKSGYNFVGWFYESNFTTEAKKDDEITENVILYAEWSAYPTITYNSNGGTSCSSTSGNVLPTLPIPTKDKHEFKGWYYESTFTTKAIKDDALSENVTLYAKWIIPLTILYVYKIK